MRRGGALVDTLASAKRTPLAQKSEVMIRLLDYGAGNVRSVINALESLGERVEIVARAEDISNAERLVFPGVGAFGSMMQILDEKGYVEPLRAYLRSGRPFLGICMGLQALFESSEEAPGLEGVRVVGPGESGSTLLPPTGDLEVCPEATSWYELKSPDWEELSRVQVQVRE